MTGGSQLLRPGLLDGTQVALAALGEEGVAAACREELTALGAVVSPEAGAQHDVLVVDAAGAHGASLAETLSEAWTRVHNYANALIEEDRGGRILLIAPDDEAACAALENLARTLSVEWARREITVVAIARGDETSAADVATLVAYLTSVAGAYFSGCLLDLRSP